MKRERCSWFLFDEFLVEEANGNTITISRAEYEMFLAMKSEI